MSATQLCLVKTTEPVLVPWELVPTTTVRALKDGKGLIVKQASQIDEKCVVLNEHPTCRIFVYFFTHK